VASISMIETGSTKPKRASGSCSNAGAAGDYMDACKRCIRHERSPLAKPQSTDQQSTMATVQTRACTILVEFERARTKLVGEAVILTNGTAGIVERLWLDEFHGLRISIRSQEGNWPVSTIKICGAAGNSGRGAQQSCGGASKTAMGQKRTWAGA
jgi:hypothetical protein